MKHLFRIRHLSVERPLGANASEPIKCRATPSAPTPISHSTLDWRRAERKMGFGIIWYNHEIGYIAGGQIGLSPTAAEEKEFASGAIGFTGLSAA